MSLLPPFNFEKWVQENQHLLEPPVNNYCLYNTDDFTVMVVGGPNIRRDYHIQPTEEFFYQVKGDMILKTVQKNEFIDIPIKQGEMFMLPANVPHSPQRFQDTIGLVVERKRPQGALDHLVWYCEKCKNLVFQNSLICVNLGTQIKQVIQEYFSSEEKRTCSQCGHVNPKV